MQSTKKKQAALLIAGILLLPATVSASPVQVNGVQVSNDAIQKNNLTMIPLTAGVLQQLDAKVNYNIPERTATITKGDIKIELFVGRSTAKVNGKSISLDVNIVDIKGDIYVPLRFLSEKLGYNVAFDKKTGAVNLVDKIVRTDLIAGLAPYKNTIKPQTITIDKTPYAKTFYLNKDKITWQLDGKYKTLRFSVACADGETFTRGVKVNGLKTEKDGLKLLGSTDGQYPTDGIRTYAFDVTGIKTLEIIGEGSNSKIINPTVE